MRPKSLKNTLLLTLAALVFASGLAISQIVSVHYGEKLSDLAKQEALNIAHNLSLDVAEKILIHDSVALQKLLDSQLQSNEAVSYLFVQQNGKVLAHTFEKGIPKDLLNLNIPGSRHEGDIIQIISEKGEHYLDVAWPVFEGRAGTLRLGFSEEPYRRQGRQLWGWVSMLTVGIVFLAILVGQTLLRRQFRPLRNLVRDVEAIDEKRLEESHVEDSRGRKEVRFLGSAFNGLLARLRDFTKRLQQANLDLEQKNRSLDLAYRQLSTSLRINREISSLLNLKELCTALIRNLEGIVSCERMSFIIFSSNYESAYCFHGKEVELLSLNSLDKLQSVICSMDSAGFLEKDLIQHLPADDSMAELRRVIAFPLRNMEQQVFGAFYVGCPSKCDCVQHERGIIELVISQASGVIFRTVRHEEEVRDLQLRVESSEGYHGMVGSDSKMQKIYQAIENVAPTDASVLIQGESGTGKELVARAIHDTSLRNNGPFVIINCSAYPATLMESELFGHEKGAFTGAARKKIGRFEQADGGTVFLDEVGEISLEAQTKLLRAIQTQRFERLGGEETIKVDVRILSATNKSLLEAVKNGVFREDLFFRLNVIPINMPPLCERKNDIPLLAKHFLEKFLEKQGKTIVGFRSEAMRALMSYKWPGNVRELENSVEHAVVLAKEELIGLEDLPIMVIEGAASVSNTVDQGSLIENEAIYIRRALEQSRWNKTKAAEKLGISRSTLYEKIKKYQIVKTILH